MSTSEIGLTGARGVLGARISEALTRLGVSVRAFPGDVRDAAAVDDWMNGLTNVVHAAAIVPTGQVADRPADAIAINVVGAANIARAAARGGARLTFISTAHVYRSSDYPIPETGAIEPVSLYGLTKLQGEQWVEALCEGSLTLRVFSYFDARQAASYLVPALGARVAAAAPREVLMLKGARSVRDMADAVWLGEVCARLAIGNAAGVHNVSAGCSESVQAIAERLAAAAGRADVRWREDPSIPANALVADRSRLAGLGDLPPFDLDAALARFVATAAPRPDAEMRAW